MNFDRVLNKLEINYETLNQIPQINDWTLEEIKLNDFGRLAEPKKHY